MSPAARRTSGPLALLLAAPLLLAACSGSDDGPRGSDEPSASTSGSASLTLARACRELVGDDGLVARSLEAAEAPAAERQVLQDRLFAIVSAGPAALQDPAGTLVDFLDDPGAYQPLDGEDGDLVTAAASEIRDTCA